MPAPIEFWFDFSSPYSYLASEKIEALAARHGRRVEFKPTLLGVIFRTTGGVPLTELVPPKATYFAHDFERSARFSGVPAGVSKSARAKTPMPQMTTATASSIAADRPSARSAMPSGGDQPPSR